MESQELLEQLRKRIDGLKVFTEIGKAVTSTLDIAEVLRVVMNRISELLTPTSWSLLYLDKSGEFLRYEILINEPFIDGGRQIPLGHGVPGWVALHRQPLFWRRDSKYTVVQLPPGTEPPLGAKSILCVPMQSRGSLLGVIDIRRAGAEAEPFDKDDLVLFSAIADYAAIAIENARNYQKAEELTITDDLSGLFNIRHFHVVLQSEVSRASKYKGNVSMIFLDLDHFKGINDRYGHLQGSQIIRETGKLLMEHVRVVDYAFRYGGDEFCVVLPETNKQGALIVAHRLQERFDHHRFLQDLNINAHLTASIGVASFPVDAKTKEDLIRLSDDAMYQVKKSTRNGVAAAVPLPPAEPPK